MKQTRTRVKRPSVKRPNTLLPNTRIAVLKLPIIIYYSNVPGVTKSTIPRSRVLVATSASHRKSLRNHRSRRLFRLPSSSSSPSAPSNLPTENRSFPYKESITLFSLFSVHLEPLLFSSFSSFSCCLYDRELVQVG